MTPKIFPPSPRRKYGPIATLLGVVAIALYLVSLLKNEVIIQREQVFMGTKVQIEASLEASADIKNAQDAIDEAFAEIKRIESVFSVFNPTGEIYAMNRMKKGQSWHASREVFDIIEKSVAYTETTQGAFDITVGPLIVLWSQAGKSGVLPPKAELERARALVGARLLILNKEERTITFSKDGMSINMGAVAKGYAADRAIGILRKSGIANALVNCGGDMYCLGERSYGHPWHIGVQHPRRKGRFLMEMRVLNKAIVTSGDYEKYVILDGKRYSHIIDPRTGYPVGDGVISATVLAGDAMTADIIATALCVLGDEGLRVARSFKGVDALIVVKEADGLRIKTTDDFLNKYEIIKKEDAKW